MRSFLLLVAAGLLSLPAAAALPADTAVLRVNRLPENGLLLATGWRYRAGDDPAWARPSFDASAWDTLNPAREVNQLPPRLRTGIGWLRLRLRPGDSLREHALLLQARLNLWGAWELYLNGRLVQRQGVLAADPAQVRPAGTSPGPVEVPGRGPAELVLALRFAPWPSPLAAQAGKRPVLAFTLWGASQLRRAETAQAAARSVFLVVGSLALLLMLLHVAFFRYNPARRANLYFAGYAGALGLAALDFYFGRTLGFATASVSILFAKGAYVLLSLSSWGAVRALYSLFGFRPGRLYRGLWVSGGLLLVYSTGFAPGAAAFVAFLAVVLLATAEQLRLTGRALRQRRGGARLVGAGFGLALAAVAGTAALAVSGTSVSPLGSSLAFVATFLPPALAISLFLAREFALDAQRLQVQLGEVERLSAQTRTQEKEKQTLLATQNETLETQVRLRTGELQRSLSDLRTTQAQLIQKEKMASLGELTAGIAHEMQNPLNFVTNFADVSAELVAELEEEQQRPARDAGREAGLLGDLKQNLVKIAQHGQRAAGIVKGMMAHSRPSAGERRPTDVNRLADECLRLAYQGARTQKASFHAVLTTDFGADLPLMTLAGADVGRALLNLFTNAFYAVRQRQQHGEAGYQPRVGVRTLLLNQQVQIQVTDNGTGMSPAVQGKVFQPFFTTKPPGEGTGLGLSLAHDIVAQGHGGTLTVESQEGQGSTFSVALPVNIEADPLAA
ncbi:MAG: hypothetical protein JWR44_3278 [Hymenobacter sp.]|jgi:two-component system NtrC family sensor kinase|nr:hypothetical protein [Hymenobacter sp.]